MGSNSWLHGHRLFKFVFFAFLYVKKSSDTSRHYYLLSSWIPLRDSWLAHHQPQTEQRQPSSFPSSVTWRDPFTGRRAVPYPITIREWNNNPSRSWGQRPLHIDTLTSPLIPWPEHTFSVRDYVGLPRPLSLPSLPTKEQFDPNQIFPLPPPSSDDEVLLFSDGSKAGSKVGVAFVHLHPFGFIIKPHLLPLPWYMYVFGAELYAASCALQYAASLSYGPTYAPPSPTPRQSPPLQSCQPKH